MKTREIVLKNKQKLHSKSESVVYLANNAANLANFWPNERFDAYLVPDSKDFERCTSKNLVEDANLS